jgi:hypothetical protein
MASKKWVVGPFSVTAYGGGVVVQCECWTASANGGAIRHPRRRFHNSAEATKWMKDHEHISFADARRLAGERAAARRARKDADREVEEYLGGGA